MLITCHNCAASYQVDPSNLNPAGSSVHCVRCGRVRFAANVVAFAAIGEAYRAEIAEFSRNSGISPGDVPAPAEFEVAPGDSMNAPSREPPAAPSGTRQPRGAVALDEMPRLVPKHPDMPRLVPEHPGMPRAPATPPARAISSAPSGRRRRSPRRVRSSMPGAGTIILPLIAAHLALIGWRADVVRLLPQTASLYAAIGLPINLRGVVFADLSTMAGADDGVPVLVVDGRLVNVTKRVVELPSLVFSLRNETSRDIYTWNERPPKASLAPGETLPFRSRLVAPPVDGKELVVRFLSPDNGALAAGI